jgi:hypothetical protein
MRELERSRNLLNISLFLGLRPGRLAAVKHEYDRLNDAVEIENNHWGSLW